jgi:hypothetical protein
VLWPLPAQSDEQRVCGPDRGGCARDLSAPPGMLGRWYPRQRSRCGLDPGVRSAAVSGPQLDRIERRERHRKFTLAVEDDDRVVEPEMDLDHPTDIAGATHPGQGQDPPTERDRVIMGNLAPVLTRRTPARDGHRPAQLAKPAPDPPPGR